jgi:hypothetical protein
VGWEISGFIKDAVKFSVFDSAGNLLFFCMKRMYEKNFKKVVSQLDGKKNRHAGKNAKIFLNGRKPLPARLSGFQVLHQLHPAGPVLKKRLVIS